MKKQLIIVAAFAGLLTASINASAQTAPATAQTDTKAKGNDVEDKASQWAAALNLNDKAKEGRVKDAILTHLTAVRDWNNSHDYTLVPEGINPATGKPLNKLERQIIINSTIPKSVHENLMAALHKDLTDAQVEEVLDKYTVGKVAFTLNGYKSIVPDLTPADESVILTNLKKAREQAIDYKNMQQISGIFEIYKTQIENYFTNSGRNWHSMFKTYVDGVKAKKAAAAGKQ
jgi:hypothetical protein